MQNKFFKSIIILIFIIVYILYLHIKNLYRKKNSNVSNIIIQPSNEHKKHLFFLGLLCFISIGFILLLNIDFDVDVYTKIKIMNLRIHMPLYYTITALLFLYFIKKSQPTIFYENYISYQGNNINWENIYKIKRFSNTKLTIYYKNGINSRIDILHSAEQEMILNQIVAEEASKVNAIIIDL